MKRVAPHSCSSTVPKLQSTNMFKATCHSSMCEKAAVSNVHQWPCSRWAVLTRKLSAITRSRVGLNRAACQARKTTALIAIVTGTTTGRLSAGSSSRACRVGAVEESQVLMDAGIMAEPTILVGCG